MRYLGVDYGRKRIGLAVGDDELCIASAVDTLPGSGRLDESARRVLVACADQGAAAIVVGVPINMDDSEGPQADVTRRFIETLRRLGGVPVYEQDERLSSFAADEAMAGAGLAGRAASSRRDKVAAQVILQAFLDRQARREPPPPDASTS